jgi:putative heme-binding domain-containing protein
VVSALLLFATISECVPCNAADDDAAVWELIRSVDENLNRRQIAELVGLDIQLAERGDPPSEEMRGAILEALAVCGETSAIEYVRGVFESDVELRDEAAHAISLFCLKHRRTPGDWQFLVRSLMVVEGTQAESVIEALLRFQQRATKPLWIRQVILVGLMLDAAGMSTADRLLVHWSGDQPDGDASTPWERLAAWQDWFREEFPEEADPVAPAPDDGARWTHAELREHLLRADLAESDAAGGAEVYRQANCAKCHRFGNIGEQRAPELTRVSARLQRKQILDAIHSPSLHLNEEYPSATVLLKDGRVLTGTVTAASPAIMLLVTLDGVQHRLEKDDVEEVHGNNASGMPSGLMDQLSERQITDLFAFLLGAGGP